MSATSDTFERTPAWIALGSNLGDRLAKLRYGIGELAGCQGIVLREISSIYETPPVGPPGQGPYLNAVARLETRLGPHRLFEELQRIEGQAGRVRTGRRNEARVLDLDLLAYGRARISAPDLSVPHPRMHQRDFVLIPLREIDPTWEHPGSGRKLDELIAALSEPPSFRVLEGETLWPSQPSVSHLSV